jgi:hypothetical protein
MRMTPHDTTDGVRECGDAARSGVRTGPAEAPENALARLLDAQHATARAGILLDATSRDRDRQAPSPMQRAARREQAEAAADA